MGASLIPQSSSGEKMIAPLSLGQIHEIHYRYRAHFKNEINNPSADNNHIVNFNLKMENFLMMNSFINLVMSGITLFGMKTFLGNAIDRYTVNYLGQRRGEWASMAIYIGTFLYINSKLNKVETRDINYLINPRELSGEIFLNTTLHHFPAKVNLELYRQLMIEK